MYKYKFYQLLLLVTTVYISSCKKYVELKPQGKTIAETVNDYSQLLNNSEVFNRSYSSVEYLTDDIALENNNLIDRFDAASLMMYKWADFYYQTSNDDPEWNLFYKQIYTSTVVIKGVPNATAGDENLKQQVIGSAKVHRAYAYLCLVNQYAKHYNPASAGNDLGVPIIKEPGDYKEKLNRASVATVYELILNDLHTATASLPALPSNKTYPSKAAAYALLARTYLYMGDYPKALENANLCLGLQANLLDLNLTIGAAAKAHSPFPDGFFLPLSENNPEVILMKASNSQGPTYPLSSELTTLLGNKDLRSYFFIYISNPGSPTDLGLFNDPGSYYAYFTPLQSGTQEGPTVPEVMLIKAECLARTQHGQDGLTVVNTLRKFRFRPADLTLLTAGNDNDALKFILQERRRELFSRGFRLFDLKRFNQEPDLVKTITHPLKNQQLTLAPGSNRYVYPIPTKIINTSPEIEQNVR